MAAAPRGVMTSALWVRTSRDYRLSMVRVLLCRDMGLPLSLTHSPLFMHTPFLLVHTLASTQRLHRELQKPRGADPLPVCLVTGG
jgi:hypothetical protein